MKKMNKLVGSLLLFLMTSGVWAQDSRLYTYSTDTLGHLQKDANGNPIDLNGVNSLFAANSSNQNSAISHLPFEIVLLGKRYNQYLIGTSGYIALGNSGRITEPFLFPNANGNTFKLGSSNNYINQGVIAPFWDIQKVKSVKQVVTGTAPNRCWVVEWQSYLPASAVSAAGSLSRYQARIYEATGRIEYVYGKMQVAAGGSGAVSATIGFSRSSALGNYTFLALADLDSFKTVNEVDDYTSAVDMLHNQSTAGVIPGLNGDLDSNCRRFVFVPDPALAPNNLRVFNLTQDSALLYWDDNSGDEIEFQLFRADRNGQFSLYQTFPANLTYLQFSDLLPSTTYSFRVRAYNQGQFSSFSNTLTFTTLSPNLLTAKQSGRWSDTATWGGVIPQEFDSVVIGNGYTVTLDQAQAVCYNLVLDNGSLVYEDSTRANGLYVWDDLAIKNTGSLRVASSPVYSNLLNYLQVRGNLVNDGVLRLYDTGNVIHEAGARLTFYETGYSEFSGTPLVNDLFELAVTRSGLQDSVILSVTKLTIRSQTVNPEGFLVANGLVGSLKLSGSYPLHTRLFTGGAGSLGTLASIWLDNDSLEVLPGNVNYLFNGGFRLSRGKFFAGQSAQNTFGGSFNFHMDGGLLSVAGSFYSNNAVAYTQTGGRIEVATAGNTTSTPSFGIATTSAAIQMTGGEIILSQPGAAPTRTDYLVTGNPELSDFNGGSVYFRGAGNNPGYFAGGHFPAWHIDSAQQTNTPVEIILNNETVVRGPLYLSANDKIDLQDQVLRLEYDSLFIEGDIFSSTSDGTVEVAGESDQNVYGAGKIQAPLFSVFLSGDTARFTLSHDSLVRAGNLSLVRGRLTGSHYLTLGDSLKDLFIEVGTAAYPYSGATLDTVPKLAGGIASIRLDYSNLSQPYFTGYEVPRNRQIDFLRVQSPEPVVLQGGLLTIKQNLTLAEGVLVAEDSNRIYLAADESADLTLGSGYIKGAFTRKIRSGETGSQTYAFPVGGDNRQLLNLEQVGTGNQSPVITVKAGRGTLNSGLGANITSLDTSHGYWIIQGDTLPAQLRNFNLTLDYRLTNGFVRLAGAQALNAQSTFVFDSIGTRLNNRSSQLRATGLSLRDTLPVMCIIPGENLGDTLFAGQYHVGFGHDFENLTAISRKLNSAFISGELTFLMTEDYVSATEEFPIFFDPLHYVDKSHKIRIQLDSGVFGLVTSNGNQTLSQQYGMIAIFGADSLEFDGTGRDVLGELTGTREWTFRTEANTVQAPVFRFENDARYNTLRGLNIHGNANNTAMSAVYFGGTGAAGWGNDHNQLDDCELKSYSATYASNGVMSQGANATNDSLIITNCEFSNFSLNHILASTNTGLGWKITGNHFFQNAASLNTSIIRSINVNTNAASTAGNMEISYNYFGGSGRQATGAAWTYSNTGAATFLDFNTRFDQPSLFKGNVFKNFSQSSTGTTIIRMVNVNSGKWLFEGNLFGGSSFNDGFAVNSASTVTVVFVPSSATAGVDFVENEFAFIRNTVANTGTTRGIRLIEYSGTGTRIENNRFHDIEVLSRRTLTVDNGAVNAIRIVNTASDNRIVGNEIYNFSNPYTTYNSFYAGIGIGGGGGIIAGNRIYNIYYNSNTIATLGQIAGIFISGSQAWDIYNNQINLDNTRFPNAALGIQGITVSSTSSTPTRVYHNSIYLAGQTRSGNSFGIGNLLASSKVEIKNNVIFNNVVLTPAAGIRSSALGANVSANFVSDHNLLQSRDTGVVFNNTTGTVQSLTAWQNSSANDRNSLTGFIPAFRGVNNLLLTSDTINWKLKAAGASAPDIRTDYEGDSRYTGQPDLGADEFPIPMLDAPVLLATPDTLCAGQPRELRVNNPNLQGRIQWFAAISGGTVLHEGDTLYTGSVDHDTVFYAQVTDTLLKSYRLAIAVKVIPVIRPQVFNVPADSICAGTQLTLVADSAQYNTIRWYADEAATVPFYTGRTLRTGALQTDTVFYMQNLYNDGLRQCESVRDSFVVKVSTAPASVQSLGNQNTCAGGELIWTINGPEELRLFADLSSSEPFLVDTIFSTGILSQNQTYYYEIYNGQCLSERQSVQAIVQAIPTAPQTDSLVLVCEGSNVLLAPASTGTLEWFDAASGSTALITGPLGLTALTADSTWYVESVLNGCRSERVKVQLKVVRVPVPQLSHLQSPVCYGSTADLAVTPNGSGQVEWYRNSTLTSLLGTGNSFTTPALQTSSYFYFTLNNGLCRSAIDSVEVGVVNMASTPVLATVDPVCYGTADTLQASSSGTIYWYTDKTAPAVASGNQWITPVVQGTGTYYLKAAIGSCESEWVSVKVSARALPQPPLVDSVSPVCRNQSTILRANSPYTIEWYNSAFATTPLDTGRQFQTPNLNLNTTYHVQSFDGYCYSQRRPVSVTLRNAPVVPQLKDTDPYCWNDRISLRATSNSSIRWFSSDTASVHFLSDTILYLGTAQKDTVVFIESFDGYCRSNRVAYPVQVIRYLDGFDFSIPDSLEVDDTTDLSALGADNNLYTWNFGNNANISSATGKGPHTISWSQAGVKRLRLVVSRRQGNVTCDTLIVKEVVVYEPVDPTGTETLSEQARVKLYPNPASDRIRMEVELTHAASGRLVLLDAVGQTVWAATFANQNHLDQMVDVSALSPGFYFVQLEVAGESRLFKIIVD